MPKILISGLLLFMLTACAEKPDGVIVMNEETIENFFEKDKESWNPPSHLNLLIDQPVTPATIPPVPPGLSRLYGTLSSYGPYIFENAQAEIKNRGSAFSHSVFGELGPAGNSGNAWLYADFNPATGEVADARAYLYGFMGGVCDMRQKTAASYGLIDKKSFRLNINGPCLFPQVSGSTMDYALLIVGENEPGTSPPTFKLHYIVNDTGKILDIPKNPEQSAQIYDAGNGKAWLE